MDHDGKRLSVTNADGSPSRVLGEPGDELPAWSPDGRRLAVVNLETGMIAIIDLETGTRRMVARGEHPVWSPDGQRIVFTKHFQTGNTLWIVNLDGTGLRRLSDRIPPRT